MNGKTHAGIAALTYITACDRLSYKFNYISIAAVIIASLLPDIDHPKSALNRHVFFIRSKGAMVALYLCLGIITLYGNYLYLKQPVFQALGICLIVIAVSSHRNGLTHSLSGLIVFACIVGYAARIYNFTNIVYWFMLGYGTHLLCDMATNRGIPLFFPFKNKKVKFPLTYRVGSKTGNFIEEGIMIIGLIYSVYRLPGIF